MQPNPNSYIDQNTNESSNDKQHDSLPPFRVLGIAMVVDQKGKGPRMVLRYPTSTTESSVDRDDLFYQLSGRQMAKLFRPKPALCGQPMTLSVGGTVFCCCAVLMDDNSEDNATATAPKPPSPLDASVPVAVVAATDQQSTTTSKDQLVLFSVIVALAPQMRTSSIPFGSWMESTENIRQHHTTKLPQKQPQAQALKPSATFMSVRRVHVSLARLCRVLEREERRCRYVSTQANLCQAIRQNVQSGEGASSLGSHAFDPSPVEEEASTKEESVAATSLVKDGPGDTSSPTIDVSKVPSIGLPDSQPDSTTTGPRDDASITAPHHSTSSSLGSFPSSTEMAPSGSLSQPPPVLRASTTSTSTLANNTATVMTTVASTTSTTTTTTPMTSRQNRQNSSFTRSFDSAAQSVGPLLGESPSKVGNVGGGASGAGHANKRSSFELEQEILETILAASPTKVTMDDDFEVMHHGNLARELLQVHHALARRPHDAYGATATTATGDSLRQTPTNLLSGRDNVVYINRHIAVVIEAVSSSPTVRTNSSDSPMLILNDKLLGSQSPIRPYHTLYFPTVSPGQLLASLTAATSTTVGLVIGTTSSTATAPYHDNAVASPRRLQLLLQRINPQKSLFEIAHEANLSLSTTMEIASYLVGQGICLALPIISRSMRLACPSVNVVRDMALAFSQTFGSSSINLFVLVSFLTEMAQQTLGETMALLLLTESTFSRNSAHYRRPDTAAVVMVRQSLLSMLLLESRSGLHHQSRYRGPELVSSDDELDAPAAEAMEDLVYQMVVWLCSQRVLVPLQDYLVSTVDPDTRQRARNSTITGSENSSGPNLHLVDPFSERKSESNGGGRLDALSDDELYQVLWDAGCLTGKISTTACCWKLSLDATKLQAFVGRNDDCIRKVCRVPMAGDDWGGSAF